MLFLFFFVFRSMASEEVITDCHLDKLDALKAHYQCEISKSIELCEDHINMTLAGSFFLIPPSKNKSVNFDGSFIKLKRVGSPRNQTGESKLSSKYSKDVQNILYDLETQRRKMDSEFKQFSKVFSQELAKKIKLSDGKLRLFGGRPPTLHNYYLSIQNEVKLQIPDNFFTKNFSKGAKSPGDMIQRALEQTVIDRYPNPDQKGQRPSIQKIIHLQRDRYDYRFVALLKKQIPNLPLKTTNSTQLGTLLGEELRSYRQFRTAVKNMDSREVRYKSSKDQYFLESSKTKSCEPQNRSLVGRATFGVAIAGLSNIAMSATKKISALKSLKNCEDQFKSELSAENFEYLSRASFLEAGLLGGATCENIRIEPQFFDSLVQLNSPEMNQFLCQMYDHLYQNKNNMNDFYKEGIQWNCDGQIVIPSESRMSASQISKEKIQIQTSRGSLVSIPIKSTQEWQFESISSDNGSLQQHLIDKIRQPFISQDARRTQLSLEYACQSQSEHTADMCEVAKHLKAAQIIKSVCL